MINALFSSGLGVVRRVVEVLPRVGDTVQLAEWGTASVDSVNWVDLEVDITGAVGIQSLAPEVTCTVL